MIGTECTKEHLGNIWSLINEKVKQHWGWVEKKACFLRKYAVDASRIITINMKILIDMV